VEPRDYAPILIVEDNADTRHLLERLLAIKGYSTVSAEDAPQALRHLSNGHLPGLIILDIHLPGIDGRALLSQMRTYPKLADIPVIAYSADPGRVPNVAASVRKGTDDPDVLLNAIAACLERAWGITYLTQ
jgi:CheY-like chemotaxis protein